MDIDKTSLRLHFFYVTLILGFLLILVATDRWSDKEKFTEYLTNAATMTSLVLGLVAIFYSFIANDGLAKSLGGIASVSTDIEKSKDQTVELLHEAKRLNKIGGESAGRMEDVAQSVNGNVVALREMLVSITEHTKSMSEQFSTLPGRFDRLENVFEETSKQYPKPAVSTQATSAGNSFINWTKDDDVTRFHGRATYTVNLLTYACSLAAKSGKELSLDEFCKLIETNIPSRLGGSLATMYSCGIFSRTPVKGKEATFLIKTMQEKVASSILPYILELQNTMYIDDAPTKAAEAEKLERIRHAYS